MYPVERCHHARSFDHLLAEIQTLVLLGTRFLSCTSLISSTSLSTSQHSTSCCTQQTVTNELNHSFFFPSAESFVVALDNTRVVPSRLASSWSGLRDRNSMVVAQENTNRPSVFRTVLSVKEGTCHPCVLKISGHLPCDRQSGSESSVDDRERVGKTRPLPERS
jgi:hypothetical protein